MPRRHPTLVIYQHRGWRWKLLSANGQVIAVSPRTWKSAGNVRRAVTTLSSTFADADVIVEAT
jgi:uncharacterized protein YegP (UPF0339 family)